MDAITRELLEGVLRDVRKGTPGSIESAEETLTEVLDANRGDA